MKIIKARKKKEKNFNSAEVVFLSSMTLLLGVLLGILMCYCKITFLDSSDSKLREIISTYNNISNNSYDKVDKDKLADSAIEGMINSLDDPYGNFMNKKDTKSFSEALGGYYNGLGITITKKGNNIVIVDVSKNSPAAKAGIKKDDIILNIDNLDASKEEVDTLANYVSKIKDKEINIKIKRDNKVIDFNVKKDRVDVQSVTSLIEDGVGYIDISTFSLNTGDQFITNLNKLKKKNVSSLIIDLRDNPGGHLGQTSKILEPFFKKGTVFYQIDNKNSKSMIRAKNKDKMNIPIVVLINEQSASASEIVASCFKENYKNVTLVGKMTYGKGTVQKDVKLSNGSSIKYTTQRWLTSKGKWLNHAKGVGLKPDVDINICQDEKCDKDMQLEKAKEIAKKSS